MIDYKQAQQKVALGQMREERIMTAYSLHPTDTGPDYRDEDGSPPTLVKCPDCGQMEWWTEAEMMDHGRCRTGQYPCACDDR